MDTIQSPEGRPSAVRELSVAWLDKAIAMELKLTEDESEYGLIYIGEKLTKCSAYLERLGEISIQLSRVSLEVTRQCSLKKSLMATKERQFKCEPAYTNGERSEKSGWLTGKLEVFRIELEDWELTNAYLVEIRGAVNDRIQLFKRLDSDIRLQHKLLESKVLLGAMGSPPGAKGSQGSNGFPKGGSAGIGELEID